MGGGGGVIVVGRVWEGEGEGRISGEEEEEGRVSS